MSSRTTSFGGQSARRPSLPERRISRRLSALSSVERGRNEAPAGSTEHELTEEIEEIKRYEDFTTIDWVQDAAREQLRRRARRKENLGFFERDGRLGWRRKLADSYEAGQAWIVVTLVGAAIGLNAAFLNIVTEWLSDVKLGYCSTAFYLNEDFCCWGEDSQYAQADVGKHILIEAGCDDWHRWTSFMPVNYLLYFIFSVWRDLGRYASPLTQCSDNLRIDLRKSCEGLRSVRGRLRNIRNQMHHCWIRHERLSRILDLAYQIDLPATSDRLWPFCWQGGSQCPLCCLHWQRHIKILWQISTQCR